MKQFLFIAVINIMSLYNNTAYSQSIDSSFFETSLFNAVQMSNIFEDSKTFVDAMPIMPMDSVLHSYEMQKSLPNFSLEKFVKTNFKTLTPLPSRFKSHKNISIQKHIRLLWDVLNRNAAFDPNHESSLISLPKPYIVPGGRFREVYYWDSYFTMLGLQVQNRWDIIQNMVENFASLIDRFGFIPNGNRSYYLSRSQPPYFALMVELLAEKNGESVYSQYLPELEREWNYWMDKSYPTKHVYELEDGYVLNRYWDRHDVPREEAYKEDTEMGDSATNKNEFYRNIRSGAESGWDFSSRWCANTMSLATIQITDLLPVDLNCLLWNLEMTLMKAYKLAGKTETSEQFKLAAQKRRRAILTFLYNKQEGWFYDYNIKSKRLQQQKTLAGFTPYFFQIASHNTFEKSKVILSRHFLKPGGLVTTLVKSGQQWDAPNGWAPLQWICIKGLRNYGSLKLARDIAHRWMQTNIRVYNKTGKLMEKYNVESIHLAAGGGEYPGQDGFGWTNGVFIKLASIYGIPSKS